MIITRQLCTALPATSRRAGPRPAPALSATPCIFKPDEPLSGWISRRLFLIRGRSPLEPIGVAEAGDKPRICSCPGAGRPARLPGFPDLPTLHHRWRIRNFPARSASPCALRLTGLAERRLECKKKITARAPVNRLRAGWRNKTPGSFRCVHGERCGTSNTRPPQVSEFGRPET